MVVAGCGLGIKMFRHSFSQSLILRTSQYLFLLLIRSCTKINIVTDSIKNEIRPSIMNIWYFHVTLHGPRRNGNREKNKLKESP